MTKNILPVVRDDVPTHDNTMMKDLAYCERLYGLKHILCKRVPEQRPALNFGGLLHIGLDALYASYKADDDAHRERDIERAAEAMVAAVEAAPFIDPDSDYRTKGRALRVLVDYVVKYMDDPVVRAILFTETPYDITQVDGFRWGGVMDLWFEHGDLGGYWIMEHKSTSRKEKYYFDNFRRDPQVLGYLLTGLELHGLPLRGVFVNCLHVLTGSHDFERQAIVFPDWLVEECKEMQLRNYDKVTQLRQLIQEPADVFNTALVKPNLYNCVGKYGRCEMYDVCDSEPRNRAGIIERELEDYHWDWRERD